MAYNLFVFAQNNTYVNSENKIQMFLDIAPKVTDNENLLLGGPKNRFEITKSSTYQGSRQREDFSLSDCKMPKGTRKTSEISKSLRW